MLEAAVVCLALNAYHEARGEGPLGMAAVSQVVVNRVESSDRRWPREVCHAVRQGGPRPLHRCQFSWYCDGRSDRPRDMVAWRQAVVISEAVLSGVLRVRSLERATCYHALSMEAPPRWALLVEPVGVVAGHVFYRC